MKTNYKNLILGAGVGGLGMGCWLKSVKKDFLIIERLEEIPMNLHNGVHYLHSTPKLPFEADLKRITLTDGILTSEGKIKHKPELQDALQYSEKVRAIQHPSSILEVGKKSSVLVPKSNNMNDYIKEMVNYIGKEHFLLNHNVMKIDLNEKEITISEDSLKEKVIKYSDIISTLPLRVFLHLSNCTKFQDIKFSFNSINILNFKVNKIVPNWLINLYIPDPNQKPYRISIMNGLASIESIDIIAKKEFGQIKKLFNMFYLNTDNSENYTWNQGKIISIDTDIRRKILDHLIPRHVFLIGRFGTWNNKLLVDTTINQACSVYDYLYLGFGYKALIDSLL